MENLQMLFTGFGTVFTPMNLGVCLLGAILGLIVGAMPGIGSLAGCALLLPLTSKFEPPAAIIMLGARYYSNMYGGAFSAILLNIPVDSPAVMTALDGHPMAKKGQPGHALMTANFPPCIGGAFSHIHLSLTPPPPAHLIPPPRPQPPAPVTRPDSPERQPVELLRTGVRRKIIPAVY